MTTRLALLREKMIEENFDWFIILQNPYVRYFSGYTGSNGLCVVSQDEQWFFTDYRYKEQSAQETDGYQIHIGPNDFLEALSTQKLFTAGQRIGVDLESVLHKNAIKLQALTKPGELCFVEDVLVVFTAVKDAGEIEILVQAAAHTVQAFQDTLPYIRAGVSERDIAAELSYRMRQLGCEKNAFDPIVASGPRSILCHGIASDKIIESGELVVLDFGGKYEGYNADITRTVMVGEPTPKQREIYTAVQTAQQLGRDKVTAGMACKDLDALVRDEISARGYGEYFGHGLGHGLGLRVHEEPRMSATSTQVLKLGNVVTIEPGIYLPGTGGVRIEDDIVIEENSIRVLTDAPREMIMV